MKNTIIVFGILILALVFAVIAMIKYLKKIKKEAEENGRRKALGL